MTLNDYLIFFLGFPAWLALLVFIMTGIYWLGKMPRYYTFRWARLFTAVALLIALTGVFLWDFGVLA
jgi:hypothetical protein